MKSKILLIVSILMVLGLLAAWEYPYAVMAYEQYKDDCAIASERSDLSELEALAAQVTVLRDMAKETKDPTVLDGYACAIEHLWDRTEEVTKKARYASPGAITCNGVTRSTVVYSWRTLGLAHLYVLRARQEVVFGASHK